MLPLILKWGNRKKDLIVLTRRLPNLTKPLWPRATFFARLMGSSMFGIRMPPVLLMRSHLTPPLLSNFRLARRYVNLGVASHLADDCGRLQAEVDAADGSDGRPGDGARLPLHLVCQPISPAFLQLRVYDRWGKMKIKY